MTVRDSKYPVQDIIRPQNVLVSVTDKSRLQEVVEGLLDINKRCVFYSTGGTGREIIKILGDKARANYVSVEEYTGTPEMEGGLVKTLTPKVHAGILGERGNPHHENYLRIVDEVLKNPPKAKGVYMDVVVCNVYPFTDVVRKGATAESARGNIDIGGPTMIMGSAKNWPSVAVVTSPNEYPYVLEEIRRNHGTTLRLRFELAKHAMRGIATYRTAIADHFGSLDFDKEVLPRLEIAE